MGRVLIRQPDGLYAVFSSGTDRWIAVNLTREQYIERQALLAAQEARVEAARLLDGVDAGRVYSGYTFAEANARSKAFGGEVLPGPLDEELAAEISAEMSSDAD